MASAAGPDRQPLQSVGGLLNLDELATELSTFRAELEGWAAAKVAAADAARKQNDVLIRETDAEFRELSAREKQLDGVAAVLGQRLDVEREEEGALREELQLVQEEAAVMPPKLAALRQSLAAQRAALDRESAALDASRAQKEAKLAAIGAATALYRDRLGLRFEHSPDEVLTFVFTAVDAEAPAREFAFAIQVDGSTYRLLRCAPEVAGAQGLLAALNASPDDFGAFVQGMRRLFQAACA